MLSRVLRLPANFIGDTVAGVMQIHKQNKEMKIYQTIRWSL